MAARRNHAFLGGVSMDQETQRAFDVLWRQGIEPIRTHIKDLDDKVGKLNWTVAKMSGAATMLSVLLSLILGHFVR